jgi:hypothetical protein
MTIRKPLMAGTLMALGHFLACLAVVPLTLRVGGALPGGASDSFFYGLLALLTKILYFPILALALYPRHWFPGQMITIPIAFNSLLWGLALALLLAGKRRLKARPNQRKDTG